MQTVESVSAFKFELSTNQELYNAFKVSMADTFQATALENGLILNDGPEDLQTLSNVAMQAAEKFLNDFIEAI